MHNLIKTTCLLIAAVQITGCATIASGTTQKVPVSSNPSGAMAKVDGVLAALTPTVFTLERKSEHTIEISKEGYRTTQVILRRAFNGMTTGNILIGGIIGTGIDAMSGSMYKLVPERVDVTLEKSEAPTAAQTVESQTQQGIDAVSLQTTAPQVVQEPVKQEEAIPPTEANAAPAEVKMANFGPK